MFHLCVSIVSSLAARWRRARWARWGSGALLLGSLPVLWALAEGSPAPPPPTSLATGAFSGRACGDSSVILVTLDGVRPRDVFGAPHHDSRLPSTLLRSQRHGVALGEPSVGSAGFFVHGPSYVSLPGYMQLFTGHGAPGCHTNRCPRTRRPTLLDATISQHGANSVALFASWAPLGRAAWSRRPPEQLSTGAQRAAPAARDAGLPPPPYRPDRQTWRDASATLADPSKRLIVLGLGDPDEHAHRGDEAAYAASLRAADGYLARIAELAARRTDAGNPTSVWVTTDHGRAVNFRDHEHAPEAARIWLLAFGARVAQRGSLAAGGARYLRDLAPTLAALLGVALPDADGRVLDELLRCQPATPEGRES